MSTGLDHTLPLTILSLSCLAASPRPGISSSFSSLKLTHTLYLSEAWYVISETFTGSTSHAPRQLQHVMGPSPLHSRVQRPKEHQGSTSASVAKSTSTPNAVTWCLLFDQLDGSLIRLSRRRSMILWPSFRHSRKLKSRGHKTTPNSRLGSSLQALLQQSQQNQLCHHHLLRS